MDPRQSLKRHLAAYNPAALNTSADGVQTQVGYHVLSKLCAGGQDPVASANKWLDDRGLRNCHAAQEIAA